MMDELHKIRREMGKELWRAAQQGRMGALLARWGREAMKQAREDLRALGVDPRKYKNNWRPLKPMPLPRKRRAAVPAPAAKTKKRRA